MKYVHIVGCKKHGKTTLLVELVRELTGRGVKVGTLKHCGHNHELDTPDTDSYRHREAGAIPAAVVTPSLSAVFRVRGSGDDPFAMLADSFADVDIVLVEGGIHGPGIKIEVWRQAKGTDPLATGRDDIVGIVTDDPVTVTVPVWPRSDVGGLADRVLKLAKDG